MPSPHGGVKRGEAKRGGMARLHWQCQGLCSPASALCVCVWPAGTGTADPPLTPGGVYRALEEEEGRVECGGAMAVTARGTYHLDQIRGACITHSSKHH